jgi:hypothetical protein
VRSTWEGATSRWQRRDGGGEGARDGGGGGGRRGKILAALRGEMKPPKNFENFRTGEGVFIDTD